MDHEIYDGLPGVFLPGRAVDGMDHDSAQNIQRNCNDPMRTITMIGRAKPGQANI